MRGQIDPIAGGFDNSRTPGGEQESRTGDSCANWAWVSRSWRAGGFVRVADPVLSMNERSWGVVEEDR